MEYITLTGRGIQCLSELLLDRGDQSGGVARGLLEEGGVFDEMLRTRLSTTRRRRGRRRHTCLVACILSGSVDMEH
jgi:hypothetical protein